MKEVFYSYIETLQNQITSALESIDGDAHFEEDLWKRKEGGGGRTRRHNLLRNEVFYFAASANLHPELEKPGLLPQRPQSG